YSSTLSQSPGLAKMPNSAGPAIYQNLRWRPIFSRYSAVLSVDAQTLNYAAAGQAPMLALWKGFPRVQWHTTQGHTIRIEAFTAKPGQNVWAPVIGSILVTAGNTYR